MPCFHRLSMDLVQKKTQEIKVDYAALEKSLPLYKERRAPQYQPAFFVCICHICYAPKPSCSMSDLLNIR